MKTLVVRKLSFIEFLVNVKPNIKNIDILILPYNMFEEINYEKEIEGKSDTIKEIVKLSYELDCIVMAGITCNLYEKHYCSVLVCEDGELLGVADSTEPSLKYVASKELKIYKTKKGNIGVIVNSDVLNEEVPSLLEAYGAKFLVNIALNVSLEDVNEKIKKAGINNNLNILSVNTNSIVYFDKDKKENQIEFSEFITKEYKI